jgi:hypothetical protein
VRDRSQCHTAQTAGSVIRVLVRTVLYILYSNVCVFVREFQFSVNNVSSKNIEISRQHPTSMLRLSTKCLVTDRYDYLRRLKRSYREIEKRISLCRGAGMIDRIDESVFMCC